MISNTPEVTETVTLKLGKDYAPVPVQSSIYIKMDEYFLVT